MKVRVTDTSQADRQSALIFFEALAAYWDITQTEALDAFARNGQLTISNYKKKVSQVDAWELGEEHAQDLVNHGCRTVRLGCSYATAKSAPAKYGMVVIDTPQGLHADAFGNTQTEHFGFIPLLKDLLNPGRAISVLYCNKRPYDQGKIGTFGYDEYAEYNFDKWMQNRASFYSTSTPTDVSESVMLAAYTKEFGKLGLEVSNVLIVPCFSDVPGLSPYAFRLALETNPKKSLSV